MGRGWYILVGLMTALIVILIGFAAYMTYQGATGMCAPGAANCTTLPPGAPGP
jgi:hypothetical protein